MVIVSYATNDGIYDRFLTRLAARCDAHGLRHDLRLIAPTTRLDACLRKPSFILEMLDLHQKPVLWLDADAVVERSFDLPGEPWDIGLVPNTSWWRRRRNPTSAFVVAAAPTEAARSFLEAWIYLCRWPELANRTDHGRLTWARQMRRGSYREIDISRSLRRAIIRDFGRRKEKRL